MQIPIASAFDVSIKDFDLDDEGNVHYSRTQDGYKEFLTVLNQWAKEGLIDTDFVSRTIDDSLKLFQNGTAGMCFAHTYNVKQSVTAGAAVDPEFKLTSCEMPRVNADDTTPYVQDNKLHKLPIPGRFPLPASIRKKL